MDNVNNHDTYKNLFSIDVKFYNCYKKMIFDNTISLNITVVKRFQCHFLHNKENKLFLAHK